MFHCFITGCNILWLKNEEDYSKKVPEEQWSYKKSKVNG